MNPKIKEWFFDNFENILDEVILMNNLKKEIIESNDANFEEEIEHQSLDEFIRNIVINCSTSLALSYDECYDGLENNLEELYYAFD